MSSQLWLRLESFNFRGFQVSNFPHLLSEERAVGEQQHVAWGSEEWPALFVLASTGMDVLPRLLWGVHLANEFGACQSVERKGRLPSGRFICGVCGELAWHHCHVRTQQEGRNLDQAGKQQTGVKGETGWKHGQSNQAWPCLVRFGA